MRLAAVASAAALTFLAVALTFGGGEVRQEPGAGDAGTGKGQWLRQLWQNEDSIQDGEAPNGSPADCGRHPYIVSLRDENNTHVCSGVLIEQRVVLTSASCVDGPEGKQQYIAVVGACSLEDRLNETNEGGKVEVFQTKQVITHENWTGSTQDGYDIALLVLNGKSSRTVAQLHAPMAQVRQNDKVSLVGWGLNGTGERLQSLQLVEKVQVILNEFCDEEASGWPFLKSVMLCTLGSYAELCRGDRGSPLMQLFAPKGNSSIGRPSFDVVVGIASFDDEEGGCTDRKPDVYTRVSDVHNWIDAKIAALPDPRVDIVANSLDGDEAIAEGAENEADGAEDETTEDETTEGQDDGTQEEDETEPKNSDCALCAMNSSLCFFCGS